MLDELYLKALVVLAGYLFLLLTSGKMVVFILSRVSTGKEKIAQKEQWDTGFIIGSAKTY